MTATDDYEKLEHQCRVLKAALRNVDGYIDFNKAAIESGFPSGERFKQHLLRCFDDGESIRTRTSIIGAGPDAPMPFAAVKTAPLTLQKAGSQKVEVSSNRGCPLPKSRNMSAIRKSENEAVDVADRLERDIMSEQLDFAKGKYGGVAWKDMLPLNMSPIEGVAFLLACIEAQKNKLKWSPCARAFNMPAGSIQSRYGRLKKAIQRQKWGRLPPILERANDARISKKAAWPVRAVHTEGLARASSFGEKGSHKPVVQDLKTEVIPPRHGTLSDLQNWQKPALSSPRHNGLRSHSSSLSNSSDEEHKIDLMSRIARPSERCAHEDEIDIEVLDLT